MHSCVLKNELYSFPYLTVIGTDIGKAPETAVNWDKILGHVWSTHLIIESKELQGIPAIRKSDTENHWCIHCIEIKMKRAVATRSGTGFLRLINEHLLTLRRGTVSSVSVENFTSQLPWVMQQHCHSYIVFVKGLLCSLRSSLKKLLQGMHLNWNYWNFHWTKHENILVGKVRIRVGNSNKSGAAPPCACQGNWFLKNLIQELQKLQKRCF